MTYSPIPPGCGGGGDAVEGVRAEQRYSGSLYTPKTRITSVF